VVINSNFNFKFEDLNSCGELGVTIVLMQAPPHAVGLPALLDRTGALVRDSSQVLEEYQFML
jgi:hypothetical protein